MNKEQINNIKQRFNENFPLEHYLCEDSWYSCPKADGGCSDEQAGDGCNCGIIEYHDKLWNFIQEEIEKTEDNKLKELIEIFEFRKSENTVEEPTLEEITKVYADSIDQVPTRSWLMSRYKTLEMVIDKIKNHLSQPTGDTK